MSQRIGLGAHIDMNHQGEALKAMGKRVRRWQIHLKVSFNLADLARWMNPIVRGWMQYYGRFYRTELHPLLKRINTYLMRWPARSTDGSMGSRKPGRGGTRFVSVTPADSPTGHGPEDSCRQGGKSRVTGDCHARFRGSRGVRFPPATRQGRVLIS